MLHIGLFEGIGGFSLAAKWMGWNTLLTSEIAEFPRKVLQYYWPDAYHHGDIKTLNYETINTELSKRYGSQWRNDDVILTGGFPCQPYSSAGKRKGKEDERHLWPEMLRVIREVQPRWVVGENVLGLVNWSGGLVFDEVHADLEAQGYEVQAVVIPAAAVNAPHGRDRVWFISYFNGNRDVANTELTRLEHGSKTRNLSSEKEKTRRERCQSSNELEANGNGNCNVTDTNGIGLRGQSDGTGKSGFVSQNEPGNNWSNFPSVSPVCSRNDGLSYQLDGITFSKWRKESIKAAGNAVVPQVVFEIFKAIEATRK